MAQDADRAQWWSIDLGGRLFCSAGFWFLMTVGAVFFAGSLYMLAVPEERDWVQIAGGIIYLPVVWLMGRSWITGLAVERDAILVCRAFPGWTERIPLSRVRSARGGKSWLDASLMVWTRSPFPLTLPGPGWFWFPPYDTLVSAVREKLEPLGKWRE